MGLFVSDYNTHNIMHVMNIIWNFPLVSDYNTHNIMHVMNIIWNFPP